MDKKFYVTPEMEIEEMILQGMIALSNPNNDDPEFSEDEPERPDFG